MTPRRRAFTLLELLAVTAIIAVLTAILAAAIERAMYQSELTVCSGNFKGLLGQVIGYTSDARWYYPHRTVSNAPANVIAQPSADDRPMFARLFSVNSVLRDPLSPGVDLETTEAPPQVDASRMLYFDYEFESERGMRRLSDRLEWKGLTFNVIAADQDRIESNAWAVSSHPDPSGRMWGITEQNLEAGTGAEAPAGAGALAGTAYYRTRSFWVDYFNWRRAPLDLNYAHNDGSVRRYDHVRYDDERFWVVPASYTQTTWPSGPRSINGTYTLLPR